MCWRMKLVTWAPSGVFCIIHYPILADIRLHCEPMQTRPLFAILIALPRLRRSPNRPRSASMPSRADDRARVRAEPQASLHPGRGPNAGKACVNATNEHAERQRALYRDVLARVKEIPREGLGKRRVTARVLRLRAENELARLEFPLRQIHPHAGRACRRPHLPLTVSQPLDTESDFETWLARIEATAKTAELHDQGAGRGPQRGMDRDRIHAEKSLQQMESIASRVAGAGRYGLRCGVSEVGRRRQAQGLRKRYRNARQRLLRR